MNEGGVVDVSIAKSFFRINKRAQFFLLAAVIISAVIISLGIGTNKVTVKEEPGGFYDFSYEVKREAGAVLDYEVYSGFDGGANLTEFVDYLAAEIEERSPGSDFIFIYGNSTPGDMKVRNYGSDSVYAGGQEIEGLNQNLGSRICLGVLCQDINESSVDFDSGTAAGGSIVIDTLKSASEISVEIEGNEFIFPLSPHRQVIFIMIKNEGGDRHIVVE